MKKILILTLLVLSIGSLTAQPVKTTNKPTTVKKGASPLKTLADSVSYVAGISVANFYKQQGITQLNTVLIARGVNDLMGGKKLLLDEATGNTVLNSYMARMQSGKKPVTKPAVKPGQSNLKTLTDSANYAIGLNVAVFYKQVGIPKLNSNLVSLAINDMLVKKKPLFDDVTANNIMNKYMNQLQTEKSKPNIEAGEKFLAKNKLRPEVKTTASGLQYEILKEGTGEKPTATDSVTCHYKGTLLNGTEFDNSFTRGQPITFSLGAVIKGWTEGLQLMSVGSKYKFYIPYYIGFGPYDDRSIPGGSMVTFEVELLAVKKPH